MDDEAAAPEERYRRAVREGKLAANAFNGAAHITASLGSPPHPAVDEKVVAKAPMELEQAETEERKARAALWPLIKGSGLRLAGRALPES